MAFKQNLPLLAGGGLVAAGLIALAVLVQRPEEDLVREAAAKYAATLGAVQDVRVHGTQADITVAGRPVLFAEFALQGGAWAFSKDLGADFEALMRDPATSGAVLQRLAQRISDRLNVSVKVKEGLGYAYSVSRDAQELVGQVEVRFAYPKQGERQMLGRYLESFRYAGGAWQSQGVGALLDRVPPPPPPR